MKLTNITGTRGYDRCIKFLILKQSQTDTKDPSRFFLYIISSCHRNQQPKNKPRYNQRSPIAKNGLIETKTNRSPKPKLKKHGIAKIISMKTNTTNVPRYAPVVIMYTLLIPQSNNTSDKRISRCL